MKFPSVLLGLAVCLGGTCSQVNAQDTPLDREQMINEMRIVAAAIRRNAEALHTWSGTYHFESKVFVRSIEVAPGKVIAGPFFRNSAGKLNFAIDLEKDCLLSNYLVDPAMQYTTLKGARKEGVPDSKAMEFSVIITPEHSLLLEETVKLGDIPGFTLPESLKRGRTIKRDVSGALDGLNMSFAVDPREFFLEIDMRGTSDYVDYLNPDTYGRNAEHFHVKAYSEEAATNLLIVQDLDGHKIQLRFSKASGYNIEEYKVQGPDGTILDRLAVSYKEQDGIFVPQHVIQESFGNLTTLRFRREFDLVESEINKSVSGFGLEALPTHEGDRYVDQIEGKVWAVDSEKRLVLPDEYKPSTMSSSPQGASWRSVLIGVNIAACIVVVGGIMAYRLFARKR